MLAPTTVKQPEIGKLKGVASGSSTTAATAFKESLPTLEGKLEQGLHAAGNEVVNGLRTVERNIEDHPELIAEGAVAVAIGVGSLVQPELVGPGLVLVGRIAADCAVKTVEEIAVEDGLDSIKAIARDVVDNSSKLVATTLTKAKVVALDVAKDLSNAIPTVNVHATMDASPKAEEGATEEVKAVANVSHSTQEPALGHFEAAGTRAAVATMLTATTQALKTQSQTPNSIAAGSWTTQESVSHLRQRFDAMQRAVRNLTKVLIKRAPASSSPKIRRAPNNFISGHSPAIIKRSNVFGVVRQALNRVVR